MSMRTEVHETRTYPSLSSRTCSTSCRAGVKEEVENSVEEKLSQSSCFFFLFLQYPIITRHDIPHPPVEISFHLSTWERERYIDSIYRGLFHQFLNSIFIEDCSASSSIIHIQEEIPPLLKNRVEKRKYTALDGSIDGASNTQQRWNPCQWPRASRFYRTVYNHASKPSITTCTTNGGSLVATRGEEREKEGNPGYLGEFMSL